MSKTVLVSGLGKILEEGAERIGVGGIWYCYDINSPGDWGKRLKSCDQQIRSFVKRRRLFASSAKAMALWKKQMPYFKNLEPMIAQMISDKVYLWPQRQLPERMHRTLAASGVAGLLSISIRCQVAPGLCGRFILLLEDQQQQARVLAEMDGIEQQLSLLQTRIAVKYGKEINPLVDYNIVNPLSAYILGQIAEGLDRGTVSEQLNLSQRGVDYHISALKELLGAKNIAQLVYRAGQYRLI